MTERQKETAFLKRLIVCDDCVERRQLETRLLEAEREERVVRRAVVLVALITALSVAGLCYSVILLPDFPYNRSQLPLRLFLVLGLGSCLCLVAYACVWARCRRLLNKLRDECRRLLTVVLEERFLGDRMIRFPRTVKQADLTVYQYETPAAAAAGAVHLRKAL
jgi:hypothetical protein